MTSQTDRYKEATLVTADTLRDVAQSFDPDLTRLTLPEVDQLVEEVSQVVPAGNVPALILSGMARVGKRQLPPGTARRDVNALFRGVGQFLDRAVYSTFFAGPAAVIWGYQSLLRLAGQDSAASFPEGTWQFYVDYALREDTARHANETHGFDTVLAQDGLHLNRVDRIAVWVKTAIDLLHDYDDILENEWAERIATSILSDMLDDIVTRGHVPALYRAWQKRLPYERGPDAEPDENYISYRRRVFRSFMQTALDRLPRGRRPEFYRKLAEASKALPAYLAQMSIAAYLQPDAYGETRVPLNRAYMHVGVVIAGGYHMIPIWQTHPPGRTTLATVRDLIAGAMTVPAPATTADLEAIRRVQRATWTKIHPRLSPELQRGLNALKLAPIIINADLQDASLPLTRVRRAERGVGDHALTLFDTGQSIIFDQSHIFFDGAWGAAFAEMATNIAIDHARKLPADDPRTDHQPYRIRWTMTAQDHDLISDAPRIVTEVGAENNQVNLRALLGLRKMFKQRNDLLQLTVNDILVLYRAIHALTYTPDPALVAALETLQQSERRAAELALTALQPESRSPAILIPVDCSPRNPKDRLHPVSFEVPLRDLQLMERHVETLTALEAFRGEVVDRTLAYKHFNQSQKHYLGALAGFGALMTRSKAIAAEGESASVGTIKLLAHMPRGLQRWLDQIPHQFDVLNDLIKGREVFSNIGRVAAGSTLSRFIAAKDDNEKKTLAWGILTDDQNVMHISLRDFRPHVTALIRVGQAELARQLTQDYLDAYVRGLNTYVQELTKITLASRLPQRTG